jgi:hypothetical protein
LTSPETVGKYSISGSFEEPRLQNLLQRFGTAVALLNLYLLLLRFAGTVVIRNGIIDQHYNTPLPSLVAAKVFRVNCC